MYLLPAKQAVGLILVPVSLIGVIINWTIVITIQRGKQMRHPFGCLTYLQSLADALFSSLFLFYVVPMIVLDSYFLKSNSSQCGFLLMIFYDISLQTHFLISCNRFIAVYSPFAYKTIFNNKGTRVIIVISVISSISVSILVFKILGCEVAYLDDYWMFFYDETTICNTYSWVGDYGKNFGLTVVDVLIDLMTIYKVHRVNREIASAVATTTRIEHRKREIDFLKQTCTQGFFLLFGLTFYFVFSQFVENQLVAFMMTTFVWIAVHSFDGVFTLIYNTEIRQNIWGIKKIYEASTSGMVTNSERFIR